MKATQWGEGDTNFRPKGTVRKLLLLIGVGTIAAAAVGCVPQLDGTDGTDPKPDGTYTSAQCQAETGPPPLIEGATYGYWESLLLDDIVPGDEKFVCADGSAYRFFVKFNPGASDLVVTLEGGGGCWDYETCEDEAGALRPFKLNTVPSDYMSDLNQPILALYPHFGRIDNGVPTNKYNQVFLPYCTGDVFGGDVVKTYTNAAGDTTTPIHHTGRRNMQAISDWMSDAFPSGTTGQLVVIGHSAGAVGTLVNYPLVRDAIQPKCGVGINDSGPIFPPGGAQKPMVEILLDAWEVRAPGALVDQLEDRLSTRPNRGIKDDFANISHGLARTFPNDRFLFTSFKEDLNFSVFSFAGSGVVQKGPNFTERILEKWDDELRRFLGWSWTQPENNWGYYFPVFRKDNCSHLVATAPVSKAHDSAFRSASIAGRADGYARTESAWTRPFQDLVWDEDGNAVTETVNRRRHFGDVLRQLLDPAQPVPRYTDYRRSNQLTFLSEPGAGVAEDTWYEDVSGALISDPQAWIDQKTDYQNPGACVYLENFVQPPAP